MKTRKKDIPPKKPLSKINPEEIREPVLSPDAHRLFHNGVGLFNSGEYWKAHEAWEEVWLHCTDESRIILQGLIQIAAACHCLVVRHSHKGAEANMRKGVERLRLWRGGFLGIDLDGLRADAERLPGLLKELEGGRMNCSGQRLNLSECSSFRIFITYTDFPGLPGRGDRTAIEQKSLKDTDGSV